MSEAEWVGFLARNTIFVAVLLGLVALLAWMTRGAPTSRWARRLAGGLATFFVVLAVFSWLGSTRAESVPLWVYIWGVAMVIGMMLALGLLVVLIPHAGAVAIRRLRG